MIRKLNADEVFLLQLIRISIGHEKVKELDFSRMDWDNIFEISIKQGVPGITFNALQEIDGVDSYSVTEILGMSESTYLEWLGMAANIAGLHEQHEKAISGLAQFYAEGGFETMLLKGYGLSLNYPDPSSRPSGDIDIWLMGKQEEADTYMKEHSGIIPMKSSHHTIFKWKGCEVENHITILEHDTHKSNIKLDKELTEKANNNWTEIMVMGQKVLLPSVDFNSCFLLRHNAIHYAIESITLRHLLDWAMFVQRNAEHIKWDEVFEFASRSKTETFLNCQNAICVQYLGFPAKSFPVRQEHKELTRRIIADILRPEFDEEVPDMSKDFLSYCKTKTKRLWKNRWKSKITNSDSFISSLVHYGFNRIKETIFEIR